MICNVALAIGKITAGILGGSAAVVADGVHSVSDLVSDFVLLVGTWFWDQPPDEDHPHGHRRIETLVTAGIGLSLAGVGIGMAWDAATHFTESRIGPVAVIALYAALASVVIKEWLYRWTRTQGELAGSPALVANAWHHRSDAFSSIPAVLAVGTGLLSPSLAWVDRVGVLLICGFILRAAWQIFHPALQQLIDAGAPPEVQKELGHLALEIDGVRNAHALRTRYIGNQLAVDLHLEVDEDLSVREGFEIAQSVKDHLLEKGPDVGDVVVQVEPEMQDDEALARFKRVKP
jgi:cation diffusion facilitator family transporter